MVLKTGSLALGILYFIIGHILVFYQLNGQFLYKSFRENDLPGGSSRLKVKPLGVQGVWVNGKNYFNDRIPNGKLIRSYLP